MEDIFIHGGDFYGKNAVDLALEEKITSLDASKKTVADEKGNTYRFEKLLIATGGVPRKLPIPGADLDGIRYYRYLDDYLRTREKAKEGSSAVVIGGGFIGSEIAAALAINKVHVTMVYPEPYICSRVFPEGLGRAMQSRFMERGVEIVRDVPASFSQKGDLFMTKTKQGGELESEMVIVGIGIAPSMELARGAGLETGDGIIVNEYLQTSNPEIYAAGDNAFFPYQALGRPMRVEHWDNALNQGRWAGRNMGAGAGALEPYAYMPYFFSDLFEFGYEAVGDVDSRLETFADWRKENDTGVVYYLEGGKVRGAMMCNVWGKVDAARELIKKGGPMPAEDLRAVFR